MSILVKNGHIFTAVDSYVADILVDDGKVRTIGIDLAADADKTIDATGKYVMPGGIDPHTHLDFPFGGTVSSDDFHAGTIGLPTEALPVSWISRCNSVATPCHRRLRCGTKKLKEKRLSITAFI